MLPQLTKLGMLVRSQVLVELRTNLPYMRMSRARLALSGLALLLTTGFLIQAIYLPLRTATRLLTDSGQVEIATILDVRLFAALMIGVSLALYILIHRFFWDTEMEFLSCMPIPSCSVLAGLATRSAITLGIISAYLAMYLLAIDPDNYQGLFTAASLASLLIVLIIAFLSVLLGMGALWPVLSRLGRPWLYVIQLGGATAGLLGLGGVQVLESLFAQDLIQLYNWCGRYRRLAPTYPVSEFLLSVSQGRLIRSAAFLSLSLLMVTGVAAAAYSTVVHRLRIPSDHGPARSVGVRFPAALNALWRYLRVPARASQLVAKDLLCLVRNSRFVAETAVCAVAACCFLYMVSRLDQAPEAAGIPDGAPILLGAIVPVCLTRTAPVSLIWGDRKLGYLLGAAFGPRSFVNWKWVSGAATVFGRSAFVICFSQVVSLVALRDGVRHLPWSLAAALASSAFSSIHMLSVSIRRSRPDAPRLALAGAVESLVVTVGGISIVLFSLVLFNLLRGNPFAQAIVPLPTAALCLISYARAVRGLKEFGRE